MIRMDLHVHSTWSDGKSTLEEIAEEACARGVRVLGFSDHGYAPYDTDCCMKRGLRGAYQREAARLREEYRGRLDIRCGVEQDLFSAEPTDGYDYVIGAVHYMKIGEEYLTVDWKPSFLLRAAELLGDIYAAAELYYEETARVAEIPGCSVIAHFDLFRKLNRDGCLFDQTHPRYRAAWQRAADRLLESGLPFEINTGAISRGYQTDPYPDGEIIDYLAARGARFLLSSDSHRKDMILYDFDRQELMARQKGLRLLTDLDERSGLWMRNG